MTPDEIQRCCAVLGIEPTADADAVNRAQLKQSLALIQRGASAEERDRLKECHAAFLAYVAARDRAPVASSPPVDTSPRVRPPLVGASERVQQADRTIAFWIEVFVAPAVVLLAIAIRISPLGFLLQGFHVWVHEFGHATVAWLTGHRALPLPIGWTNIEPDKSLFVYFGVLFLLGVLAVAGWRERKPVAVAAAIGLAGAQAYCTWVLPQHEVEKWIAFSGVGGEFYLSAAMMAAFYFHFPAKFRWEVCRWIFLFIGAATFSQAFALWRAIAAGREGIPWGSMIGGEDDASGDMDTLRDDFRWTEHHIVATYHGLGYVCVAAVGAVYVFHVLMALRARNASTV